jgi:hypothetical protein
MSRPFPLRALVPLRALDAVRLALAVSVMSAACTGSIATEDLPDEADRPVPPPMTRPAPMGTAGSAPARPAGPSGTPGADPARPPDRAPAAGPPSPATHTIGHTPLRRLARAELVLTLTDAFPGLPISVDPSALPQDELVAGFSGQSTDLLTDAKLDGYLGALGGVAKTLATDASLAPCNRMQKGDAACVTEALTRRLPRLWRRPVQADEVKTLVEETFTPLLREHGFAAALEAVWLRALLSPSFLFKMERGTPQGEELFRLTDHELAARLSYFLWRSPPDDALRALAEAGTLRDPATLRAEVERLLDHPRAAETFKVFHTEWLRLRDLDDRSKPREKYPMFSESLRESMVQETTQFLDHVTRKSSGAWTDLLTARYSFVDSRLAALYGVIKSGSGFVRVDLPDSRRAGVLTHGSYLTVHSHAEETQMIHRGLVVREQLLCTDMPLPDNVDVTSKEDRLTSPLCGGCHMMIEAIGTGFETYDGIGTWRDRPAAGKVLGLAGGDRAFEGVPALAQILAEAPEVRECLARQWFRFALGRREDAADGAGDRAAAQAAAAALGPTGGVRGLITALVESDAFRYRRERPAGACN